MTAEDEARKQRIWDEILKSSTSFRPEILPCERTKAQLMAEYNLTRNQVETILKEMLERGQILKRPALRNGKPCIAYSLVLDNMKG